MSNELVPPQAGQRRSEAFFGRRKSKGLSPKQQKRFETLFPKLKIDIGQPAPDQAKVLFPEQPEAVIMEIGFGGAEHLVHQAKTYPNIGFIGVEPFVNSMAKALRSIEENNLTNILLYDEDAVEVLDWLPAGVLDRVDLLYPDPWPKMRHWKRRFVNQVNLDRMARVLRSGAIFRFASDIDSYINWTLGHCHKHRAFEWKASDAADWHTPYPNWIRTRYEAKAVREGRTPCYLSFEHL